MNNYKYVLVDKKPVVEPNLLKWGQFMNGDTHVAEEVVGGYRVSTVFLGLDHGWGDSDPILFETMVFQEQGRGRADDELTERYCTWEEAEEGHKKIVESVKKK